MPVAKQDFLQQKALCYLRILHSRERKLPRSEFSPFRALPARCPYHGNADCSETCRRLYSKNFAEKSLRQNTEPARKTRDKDLHRRYETAVDGGVKHAGPRTGTKMTFSSEGKLRIRVYLPQT